LENFADCPSGIFFKSNVRETWRVILVSEADIFVAVHLYCSQQRDFADASHSKSAKSAARAVSYGIFSSENSYMQVKHLFCAESLRILAERLSQSETQLPLRQICYYSPPEEVGVFSTEIKTSSILPAGQKFDDSARYVE
jgi:hypothetical protein